MFLWIVFGILISSFILILSYIEIARYFNIICMPSERRNHDIPTPRGGGIVVIPCIAFFTFLYLKFIHSDVNSENVKNIMFISLFLCFIFFLDDVKNIRRSIRFFSQIIAACLGFYVCGEKAIIFDILPYWLNGIIVVFGWVWFMNLYNFMDGIDGMTSSNTIFFSLSIIFIGYFVQDYSYTEFTSIASVIAFAMFPFLVLNWHPAKIHIGDSGSISLGFIIGYIFLCTSHYVGLVIPTIIPSYYLFDSTLTLLRRLIKKENILEPHSKHFFQLAKRSGISPKKICLMIFFINITIVSFVFILLNHNTTLIKISIAIITAFLNIALLYKMKRL